MRGLPGSVLLDLGLGVGVLVPAPGGAVGGGGEAADVVAVLGDEDQPQDEGPLQEEGELEDAEHRRRGGRVGGGHGEDQRHGGRRAVGGEAERSALRRGVGPHPPEGEGNRRVTASGEGWGGTARIRAITG